MKPGDPRWPTPPSSAQTPEAGLTRIEFEETRPLPSYLVAFVVGPFDLVDGGAGGRDRVPIRFVVPKGRGAETRYAASVTAAPHRPAGGRPSAVAYPYAKCDVAVVPRFWGTMEHPGLVALGQPLTLILPGEETRARREEYVNIALHELAHHWFGDLVTNAWWDDTWLNEALASWLDPIVTDRFDPSWRALATRRWKGRAEALAADALPSARRLREPVVSRHEIEGSFDNAITYAKGSSVAAMFEAWMGSARWGDVLRRHLDARAHANASSGDFLAALSAVVSPEAAEAFRGYLDRPGVARLQATVRCGPGVPRVKITQERFLAGGRARRRRLDRAGLPPGRAGDRAGQRLRAGEGTGGRAGAAVLPGLDLAQRRRHRLLPHRARSGAAGRALAAPGAARAAGPLDRRGAAWPGAATCRSPTRSRW